jgi:two-component system, OmpR family, sensor histidine kinase CssS
MKRFRTLFEKMSLTQQLMTVVMVSLSFFIAFVFIFIFGNINTLVRDQLVQNIHVDQSRVIQSYQANATETELFKGTDTNIVHLIYSLSDLNNVKSNAKPIDDALLLEIKGSILNQSESQKDYTTKLEGSEVIYTITRFESDKVIVSYVVTSTMNTFKLSLVNGVVNILLIIVGMLFLLLMMWVGYLIHSLKQIEAYIDAYRKGENPTLKIDRHDEVGDLAEAIVSMNNELKRQEQLKEEMVQNISHDLKTPIATIKSYGESIKDGIYPYETLEKSVDVIIEHATRLEKKVHSLLLLNRMGYLVSEDFGKHKTELKQLVEKVILSLKVFRPRIHLHTNLEETYFIGLEEPWRVVIENILDNALRYAKTEIRIDLKDRELKIYNDGDLIPEDMLSQLFNPYEKGKGGQFGLGLAIVKRVVDAYGYRIKVENVDKGVLFTISERIVVGSLVEDL